MAKKIIKVYPSIRKVLVSQKVQTGLTNAQLSELTGLSECSINFYLTGRRKPNLVSALRLSKALGITLDSLAQTSEVQGSAKK